jgi:hypothetical protein
MSFSKTVVPLIFFISKDVLPELKRLAKIVMEMTAGLGKRITDMPLSGES